MNLKKQITHGNGDTNKFDGYINIKKIQKKYPEIVPESFESELVSDNDVKKKTKILDTKRSSTCSSILLYVSVYFPQLINAISYSFQYSTFAQELRLPKVIPLYKKLDPSLKKTGNH